MNTVIAAEEVYGIAKIAEFYDKGGVIMYLLTFCSLLTVAVIIYKALDLNKARILPDELKNTIDQLVDNQAEEVMENVQRDSTSEASVLARLARVVLHRRNKNGAQIREAVQAKAHEEIVKLQGGIGVLDVVIVVAPMLGLLGTASGITTVFDGLGSVNDVKMSIMAAGVAEALSTTIAGLAVAVPAVIAHGYFNRKIETYASQLEVVMGNLMDSVSSEKDKA